MEATLVTSKGQVTIPKVLRQKLGIRQGSRIEFLVVGDHAEFRVKSTPIDVPASGFGMVKSKRRAVPADFDPPAYRPGDAIAYGLGLYRLEAL